MAPAPGELESRWAKLRGESAYGQWLKDKTQWSDAGKLVHQNALKAFENGEGTRIVVAYAALETENLGMGFTPFGLTPLDGHRTLFGMAPISVRFPGTQGLLVQTRPRPLLRDEQRHELSFRLEQAIPLAAFLEATGLKEPTGEVASRRWEWPGMRFKAARAVLSWSPDEIRIRVLPGEFINPPKAKAS